MVKLIVLIPLMQQSISFAQAAVLATVTQQMPA
jgi:hypothetical protein